MIKNKLNYLSLVLAMSGLFFSACGDDDTGPMDTEADVQIDTPPSDTPPSEASLRVLLGAEGTIGEGIPAGSSGESITDGWAANFTTFAMAIGPVEVVNVSNQAESHAEETRH